MARGKTHKSPNTTQARNGAHHGKRSAAGNVERSGERPGEPYAGQQAVQGGGRAKSTVETDVRRGAQPGMAERTSIVEDFPGTDRHDIPDPMDTTGNEVENGPDVDPSDPNLSAVLAESDGEEANKALGMRGDDTMMLDDPEEDEDIDPESLEADQNRPGPVP